MKRKIPNVVVMTAITILVLQCAICLYGCGMKYDDVPEQKVKTDFGGGYFATIKEWTNYRIVYAKDTGVKYLIMDNGSHQYGITPLYNADGTLQVYDGHDEQEQKE